MKTLHRIPFVLSTVVIILQIQTAAAALNATDAPAGIIIDYLEELYSPVEFNHSLHTDMYRCNACHHHTTGELPANASCRRCHDTPQSADDPSCAGCHPIRLTDRRTAASLQRAYHIDMPDLKGAMHLQCLGCHATENGPTGCQDCHAFTPAGRKRFALPDDPGTLAYRMFDGTPAPSTENAEGE